jgi:hypothetical protein
MTRKGRILFEETSEILKVFIPVRRRLGLLPFTLLFLLFWFAGGCFAVWSFANTYGAGSIFTMFWLFGWTLGMVHLGLILSWGLFGTEQVIVTGNELRLVMKLPWFGWTRKYRRDWIREVSVNREKPSMLNPLYNFEYWGILGSSIRIRYGYSSIGFGIRLDASETTAVVDTINAWLEKQELTGNA